MNFKELGVSSSVQHAVKNKGFVKASEIQEQVIPEALTGRDIVGKARTGTGKTAAFAIPIIELTPPGQRFSALIVVPTRELAKQVEEETNSIAAHSKIKAVAVYGGESINVQIGLLRRNQEIIVGTPGRLLYLISRRVVTLNGIKILVLDEADKMFDMGFRIDIGKIISMTPKDRQTMVFSATIPSEIKHLIDRHMKRDKVVFDLSEDNAPVEDVEQFYVMVDQKRKADQLVSVLKAHKTKTLVFCRTKRTVDWLERQLNKRRVKTLAIHGDKTQAVRNKMIERFKESVSGILIATDVVARGIHVEDIGLVVNYDFPQESDTYIHRIGRTARQGRKGTAVSFCTSLFELKELQAVARRNNTKIIEAK
ncbi:MAG: DEAD/DEAH box helicase [Candidatus Micrarchaeota archaeon]